MSRVAVVRDSDLAVRAPDELVRAPDELVRAPDDDVRAIRTSDAMRTSDDAMRTSDDAMRTSDAAVPDRLREAQELAISAGNELVPLERCEVVLVLLTAGSRGLADRTRIARPHVAIIARSDDPVARGFAESDRSSVETDADAYVLENRKYSDALAWVLAEDPTQRMQGQPRLTVVGTLRDDFGMSRPLKAEPTIIGRSASFGEHPQRPDRMPTPTGSIARHHAQVRCVDGVVAVRDLGSTNGTLVIRRGEPARLLCPQDGTSGREFGPPATAWLIRDPTPAFVELRFGDHLQLPGFWRFRVDGDPAWIADD